MPSFARQLMPAPLLNAQIRNSGVRMNWLKSHVCPCTMSSDSPGSPNATCLTCHGRGRYWDDPIGPFIALRTFTSGMGQPPDEPGAMMDPRVGQQLQAEPTITIGSDVMPVWSEASEFDAFQEIDALVRFETALVVGQNQILPYQLNLDVQSVTAYNTTSQTIIPLPTSAYTVTNGEVTLHGYPKGTAFTVMYKANMIWIAWRRSGGMPHSRMFGGGTDALPTRFRVMMLDLWLRARNQTSISTSPNTI